LTAYDEQHLVTYLRLLDADAADWHESGKDRCSTSILRASLIVLGRHLTAIWPRAKWLSATGYRQLLRGGAPT